MIALDAEDDALVYVGLGGRVTGLLEHAARHRAGVEVDRRKGSAARAQLLEYLGGGRQSFELRLRPLGTTFQRRAWEALVQIPFGQTRSYADQAHAIGMHGGARAVGGANGANPLPIVVPCHRVLGASGKMTGFGGGVDTKRWLLALERDGRVPGWTPAQRAARSTGASQLGLFA